MQDNLPLQSPEDNTNPLKKREEEQYLYDKVVKRIKDSEESMINRVMLSLCVPFIFVFSSIAMVIDFYTDQSRDTMEKEGIIARVPYEYRTKENGEQWVKERCDRIYEAMDDRFLSALDKDRLKEVHATTAKRTRRVVDQFNECLQEDLLSSIDKKGQYDKVRKLHASHVRELKGFMKGVRRMYDVREELEAKLTIYAPLLREEGLYNRVNEWIDVNLDKGLTIITDKFVRVREVDELDRKGEYAIDIANSYNEQFQAIIDGLKESLALRQEILREERKLEDLQRQMNEAESKESTLEEKEEILEDFTEAKQTVNETKSAFDLAMQKAREKLNA